MDAQDLVTGVRWELLHSIAEQPQTGAELAKQLGTSQANVSQHLKLLELSGLVNKERVNGKSMHYKLKEEAALITVLASPCYRGLIPLDAIRMIELRLLLDSHASSKYLRRMILEYEDIVRNFTAFGLITDQADIQLFVVADDVKHLRKEYANIKIGDKKIVIWSHTPAEIEDGLARREHYFVDKIASLAIYLDKTGQLSSWKEHAMGVFK